jgi:hypothetical protein
MSGDLRMLSREEQRDFAYAAVPLWWGIEGLRLRDEEMVDYARNRLREAFARRRDRAFWDLLVDKVLP